MSHTYNSLSNCISSLSASVALLNDSLKTIDNATKDIPRLKKVLSTNKVFGLVPELDLESAKRNIQNEVQPQINALVLKIEKELSKLKRKKTNLASKVDLQQVRLENAAKSNRDSLSGIKGITANRISKGDIDELKLARLKLLQNKKERLKYSLSRLNLQDKRARLSTIPSLPPHRDS